MSLTPTTSRLTGRGVDESKKILADFRHRALRHHAEGIFMAETVFGRTITLSSGRVIPTRWVGEQHVIEDLGRIPSFADWARAISPESGWAARNGSKPLSSSTQRRPAFFGAKEMSAARLLDAHVVSYSWIIPHRQLL